MNFEAEYKKIIFNITLEKVTSSDFSNLSADKFNRFPNQTLIELKKGNLVAYNLLITSRLNLEERTHYWSNIILTCNEDELQNELNQYLNDEEILDSIVLNWKL